MAQRGLLTRSMASLALVALSVSCSPQRTATPEVKLSPPPETAAPPPATLSWERLDTSGGPGARRDYSLTADGTGSVAFLFGGRSGSKSLGDLWAFDVSKKTWEEIPAQGPKPRFGHNAAFIGGALVVFGGQGGPSSFFNDLWKFDVAGRKWQEVDTGSTAPAARYGAGGTVIEEKLFVSHGFTNSGRFDDSWSFGAGWADVSPGEGPRPIKRCLHRVGYLAGKKSVVLFGGQTNSNPFLGDTWLYDPASKKWTEIAAQGPSPRNLFAFVETDDLLWLFGGKDEKGLRDDLWSFDGATWKQLEASGPRPAARSGIDAARVAGKRLLIFGGSGAGGELNDLWQLTLP